MAREGAEQARLPLYPLLRRLYPLEERPARLSCYALGGHYPAHIGQVLAFRYVLCAKSRSGQYSTAWLAFDCRLQLHVSLHIFKAAPLCAEVAFEQIGVMQRATAAAFRRPGKPFRCEKYQNSFVVEGGHSRHFVVVAETLGVSLEELLAMIGGAESAGMPADLALRAASDALHGLAFLHDEERVAHCALRLDSLYLALPSALQSALLCRILGDRRSLAAARLDGWRRTHLPGAARLRPAAPDPPSVLLSKKQKKKKRKQRQPTGEAPVAAQRQRAGSAGKAGAAAQSGEGGGSLGRRGGRAETSVAFEKTLLVAFLRGNGWQAKLGDFACARELPAHPQDCGLVQRDAYRAPELLKGLALGLEQDVWSWACLLFRALTAAHLFPPDCSQRAERLQALQRMRAVQRLLRGEPSAWLGAPAKSDAPAAEEEARAALRGLAGALGAGSASTAQSLQTALRRAFVVDAPSRPRARELLACLVPARRAASPSSTSGSSARAAPLPAGKAQRRDCDFPSCLRALLRFIISRHLGPITFPEERAAAARQALLPAPLSAGQSTEGDGLYAAEGSCSGEGSATEAERMIFTNRSADFERLKRLCDRSFVSQGCLVGYDEGIRTQLLDSAQLIAELYFDAPLLPSDRAAGEGAAPSPP